MIRARDCLRIAVLSSWLANPLLVAAQTQKPAPFQLMRSLQDLQNRIASGNREAHALQPQLVREIADAFQNADVQLWHEPKNMEAAALFLLSGGPPRAVQSFVDRPEFSSDLPPILKGALAYSQGRETDARQWLDPIEAYNLQGAGGAQLALIQAGLLAHQNPSRALELLDMARVLGVGSLVEEAALRRQIFIVEETGNVQKFGNLVRQYASRFKNSVYADPFLRRFKAAALKFVDQSPSTAFLALDEAVSAFPASDRCDLFVEIAGSQLVAGKLALVQAVAGRASTYCAGSDEQRRRIAAYTAIYELIGPDSGENYSNIARSLAAPDVIVLPVNDRALVDMALALDRQIHSWPDSKSDARALQTQNVPASIPSAEKLLLETARVLETKSQ